VLENALRLIQPLILGWAINGLISRSYHGLAALIGQHVACMLVSRWRQSQQTRVIDAVSTDAMSSVLAADRLREDLPPLSRQIDHAREVVGHWEQVVPQRMHVAFSMVGALLLLGWYDVTLVPLCLALLIPAVLLNVAHGRKSSLMWSQLRAEYEREAAILATGESRDVRRHFESLARWRRNLTEAAASNACLMDLFVLGLLGTTLVHYCWNAHPPAGDVFAVFQYVLMFIAGLGHVPHALRGFSIPPPVGCRAA
jgi:hypothetical protein